MRASTLALAALAATLMLGLAHASWVLHGHEDVEVSRRRSVCQLGTRTVRPRSPSSPPHTHSQLEWHRFRRHFGRRYRNAAEEEHRFEVFQTSFHRALARNAANVRAGGQRVFGVTRFSDETQEEFDRRYKGRKGHVRTRVRVSVVSVYDSCSPRHVPSPPTHATQGRGARWEQGVRKPLAAVSAAMAGEQLAAARPAAVDWTGKATTSVNNQGQCGSCWAFSLTQQVESAWIMAGHAPWRLSVQQVTSCTSGTFGCGGGDTIEGYEQLLSEATKHGMPVPGLVSAAMAPYMQSMVEECLSPRCTEHCTFRGVGNLTEAEEAEGLTGFYVELAAWDYGCVRARAQWEGGH